MILEEIQRILEKEDYSSAIFPSSEKNPSDQLSVFLGLDVKKRERLLEITADKNPYHLSEKTSTPARIQFRISLPFDVIDSALPQVASLLLFINHYMSFPGFELNELEGQVIYRYVWITQSDPIHSSLILCIVEALTLHLNLFSETIESLANGSNTFNDLLSQITALTDLASKKTS